MNNKPQPWANRHIMLHTALLQTDFHFDWDDNLYYHHITDGCGDIVCEPSNLEFRYWVRVPIPKRRGK